MVFGFLFIAVGYAMFYWGLHHFCGVDCPTTKTKDNPGAPDKLPSGGTNTNDCACRYSMIDLLALNFFKIARGKVLVLNPSGQGEKTVPPTQPSQSNQAPSGTLLNPSAGSNTGTSTLPGSQIPGIFGQGQ